MPDIISPIISFFTDKRNSLGKRITLGAVALIVALGFVDDFGFYHHFKTTFLLERIEKVQKAKEATKDKQSLAYNRLVELESQILNRTSFMSDLLSIYKSSLEKIQPKVYPVTVTGNHLYGYLSTGEADSLYKALSINGLIVSSGSKLESNKDEGVIASIKNEDTIAISPLINTLTTSAYLVLLILFLMFVAIFSLFSKNGNAFTGFIGAIFTIFLTMLLVWLNQWFIGKLPLITHSLIYSNIIYQAIIVALFAVLFKIIRHRNKKYI